MLQQPLFASFHDRIKTSARARDTMDVELALTELEDASPIYVRDRRIPALQMEPNAPLASFSPFVEDAAQSTMTKEQMQSVIRTTRDETEKRMRGQAIQLRRFHQQICLRVNERAMEERARAQARDKRVDEKLARLLPPRSYLNPPPTEAVGSHMLSCETRVEALLTHSKQHLQATSKVYSLVQRAVLDDAEAREMLLVSTRVPRVRPVRKFEENKRESNRTPSELRDSSFGVPKDKQADLYAVVRRRYMQIERERIKQLQRDAPCGKQQRCRIPPSNAHKKDAAGQSRLSKHHQHVNIVDASAGSVVKMKRESARSSSTPWRKSTPAFHVPTADERFLQALQEHLDTPALCPCSRSHNNTPCANNCELYQKIGMKEKLATSVCRQHQVPSQHTQI